MSQILPRLQDATNRLDFSQRLPAKVSPDYNPAIEIRRKLEARLEPAIQSEDKAWRLWEKEVAPEFRPSVSATVEAVRRFVLFAVDHGKSQLSLREILQQAESRLGIADLEAALAVMKNLLAAQTSLERGRILSINFPPILQAAREWKKAAEAFVRAVAYRTETDSRAFGAGEGNLLEGEVKAMETACAGIINALRSLVGVERSVPRC